MSPRRPPSAPPEIPGFTYRDLLGSGGFADVFLYDQQLPRRRVAVKVLLTDRMSSGSATQFADEANVMAMLSTHPAIVTIYQAGLADDGRPYLVMEYCPKPNLQVRYKREPFGLAESLRVGVQVAGAVETAHRAGVLHRDIKPANILVTEYNRPALTDFGIASTTDAAAESAGLSIPWSPPESFADEPRSDVRSDVYALGATLYTLLAGRSPFELAGRRNTAADLIERIETMPPPPLGRPDTPDALQQVLERALAKNPADRPQSALAFARALQKVQIALSLAVTPVDILDDGPGDDLVEDEEDGLTRVRGVVSIDPNTATAAGATHRPEPTTSARPPRYESAPVADHTHRRADLVPPRPADPDPEATVARAQAHPAPAAEHAPADEEGDVSAPPRSRRGLWIGVGTAAAIVAIGIGTAVAVPMLTAQTPTPAASAQPTTAHPVDALPTVVPAPEDLSGTVDGDTATFTWRNPDTADGDVFLWNDVSRPDDPGAPQRSEQAEVSMPVDASGRTCISVRTLREDGASSPAVTECAS